MSTIITSIYHYCYVDHICDLTGDKVEWHYKAEYRYHHYTESKIKNAVLGMHANKHIAFH